MMTSFQRLLSLVILLLSVSWAVGCKTATKPPELGSVKGVVTLDGKPLAGVAVMFIPRAAGRTCVAVTDDTGAYKIEYDKGMPGATLGSYVVRISSAAANPLGREAIPENFNSKTTLEATVASGDNTIDFKLQSN